MAPSRKRAPTSSADLVSEGELDAPDPIPRACLTSRRETAPQNLAGPADPLARRPDETELQHRRFLAWVSSNASGGARSLSQVARTEGIHESTLRETARRHEWQVRASEHDRAAIERELGQGMAVQRRSVVRQVQLAERVDALLERALAKLEDMLDADDAGADEVTTQVTRALDLIKAGQRSQALMRTAVGLPNSTTKNETTVNVLGLEQHSQRDMYQVYRLCSNEELLLVEEHEKLMKRLLERYDNGERAR